LKVDIVINNLVFFCYG